MSIDPIYIDQKHQLLLNQANQLEMSSWTPSTQLKAKMLRLYTRVQQAYDNVKAGRMPLSEAKQIEAEMIQEVRRQQADHMKQFTTDSYNRLKAQQIEMQGRVEAMRIKESGTKKQDNNQNNSPFNFQNITNAMTQWLETLGIKIPQSENQNNGNNQEQDIGPNMDIWKDVINSSVYVENM